MDIAILTPNVALAFGIVFGILIILTGLILTVVGLSTLRQWQASKQWPIVPARIVSSRVLETPCFEDQIMFKPVVSYTFLTGGGEVTGNDIAFVGKMYGTRERAAKEISHYPAGVIVKVRYNPDALAESVLIRRGGLAGFLLMLSGLACIIGTLLAAQVAGLPAARIGVALAGVFALVSVFGWRNGLRLSRARRTGIYPQPGKGSDRDVERLVMQGEKMLAIRLYRELHKTELKTSRLRIEELAARLHK